MPLQFKVNQVQFVNRALAAASAEIQQGARLEIQAIGELVASGVTARALGEGVGADWAAARVGQNAELVYVVPWERGTRVPRRKRRSFAPFMLRQAYRPARDANAAEIDRRFKALVDRVTSSFNRGA